MRFVSFISKLEYLTPKHKREKRLFKRKHRHRLSPIAPREFAAIFQDLAPKEPKVGNCT